MSQPSPRLSENIKRTELIYGVHSHRHSTPEQCQSEELNWHSSNQRGMAKCYIWALMQENLSSVVCEQQRRRPACISAQTDQSLCYSLFGKYHIYPCYRRNFNFLASLCSWYDWFESRFVGNPEDRFCHVEAHFIAIVLMCQLVGICECDIFWSYSLFNAFRHFYVSFSLGHYNIIESLPLIFWGKWENCFQNTLIVMKS